MGCEWIVLYRVGCPANQTDPLFLVRFLELVRPFMGILPEVTAPERKVRSQSRSLSFSPLLAVSAR